MSMIMVLMVKQANFGLEILIEDDPFWKWNCNAIKRIIVCIYEGENHIRIILLSLIFI